MPNVQEKHRWTLVFAVLVAFAVPWFLWRSDAVAAGLPVWLWWHVAWMAVAALAFRTFAVRAWGLGVEEGGRANVETDGGIDVEGGRAVEESAGEGA